MKHITLILLYFVFHSPVTLAWTTNADFENGTIGEAAENNSGFSTSRDNTTFSNNYSHNGSKSAKASINAGQTGGMGGTFFFDTKPGQGDELWWSCSVFFPTGFDFTVGGGGLKLMRVQTIASDGTSDGYHNILMKKDGLSINSAVSGSTFTDNNSNRAGLGGSIGTGKWHTFETYFKFDASRGIWRIWKDGKLVFEDTQTHTLKSTSSKGSRALLFTYWNDGAPATQSAYIDECVVTTDTPSKYDAAGNEYIGTAQAYGVAPPSPPGGFSLSSN